MTTGYARLAKTRKSGFLVKKALEAFGARKAWLKGAMHHDDQTFRSLEVKQF